MINEIWKSGTGKGGKKEEEQVYGRKVSLEQQEDTTEKFTPKSYTKWKKEGRTQKEERQINK